MSDDIDPIDASPLEATSGQTGPYAEREVGVGPWPGGRENWPTDSRYDPELLAEGDRRNVVDQYRYWHIEAIVADLDKRRHGFHVAIENWGHDFNIGSIVRTANAFLAAEIHIIGRRRWNRRGAMVTDRYQHIRHHESVAELIDWAATADFSRVAAGDGRADPGTAASARLPIIGIDNVPGSSPIEHAALPRNCVLLFGAESEGLSEAAVAGCDAIYDIAQFGSTRSINAGAAAAIAMHAWIAQYGEISG